MRGNGRKERGREGDGDRERGREGEREGVCMRVRERVSAGGG